MKVMLVFGTRPEAIKMIPLWMELARRPTQFQVTVCVTGQHREMLHQVLKAFDLTPDIDLDLMQPGQDLSLVTSNVLLRMRDVLTASRPDLVVVQGDTTTAFAAGLAAFYQQVSVAHVEAGLRTHDIRAPFPEELNRQLVSRMCSLHFAPTAEARNNLLAEGINADSVYVTGNTVIDALLDVSARIDGAPTLARSLAEGLVATGYRVTPGRPIVLVTGHRRENFGDSFVQICEALRQLSIERPAVDFVYPVHLNPNVRAPVNQRLRDLPNVHLIEPLDYLHFVYLLKQCHLVLTDSGGIQEEAPSLGKPVLVMRNSTERPEGVSAGTVKLVGAHRQTIVSSVGQLLDDPAQYSAMSRAHNPYGDGTASRRIADAIFDSQAAEPI